MSGFVAQPADTGGAIVAIVELRMVHRSREYQPRWRVIPYLITN
jgi:hypothetical protein